MTDRMTPEELTARRVALGLSLNACARALGIDKASLSRYESGSVRVPGWMPLALLGVEVRQKEEAQ